MCTSRLMIRNKVHVHFVTCVDSEKQNIDVIFCIYMSNKYQATTLRSRELNS